MRVIARPLDEAGFARYGRVVRRPTAAGRTALDDVLASAHPEASLRASMSRLEPVALPMLLPRMERHPHAVQLFVPLRARRYLAVTALGADAPDPATLKAFVVPGEIGIGYGIGVWHVPMMVLDDPGVFLVLMHRVRPEIDEEWHTLAEPIELAGAEAPDVFTSRDEGENR